MEPDSGQALCIVLYVSYALVFTIVPILQVRKWRRTGAGWSGDLKSSLELKSHTHFLPQQAHTHSILALLPQSSFPSGFEKGCSMAVPVQAGLKPVPRGHSQPSRGWRVRCVGMPPSHPTGRPSIPAPSLGPFCDLVTRCWLCPHFYTGCVHCGKSSDQTKLGRV